MPRRSQPSASCGCDEDDCSSGEARSAARCSIARRPRPLRWAGSRPSGWPPMLTCKPWRICPPRGSTGCMTAIHRRHYPRPDSSEIPTLAGRRARPTTATSAAPAITRPSSSISSARPIGRAVTIHAPEHLLAGSDPSRRVSLGSRAEGTTIRAPGRRRQHCSGREPPGRPSRNSRRTGLTCGQGSPAAPMRRRLTLQQGMSVGGVRGTRSNCSFNLAARPSGMARGASSTGS